MSDGLSLQPQAASLYVARGVLYVQLAEYEKAEADFERANQLDPAQSLSVAAQGLTAVQANDLDKALATVQEQLARKPNDASLYICGPIFSRSRGPSPARRSSRRHWRRQERRWHSGRRLPGTGSLARLYLQAGQTQEAIEQCRRALAIDPKDQTSLYRLIQALRKTGNKSEIPGFSNGLRSSARRRQKKNESVTYKIVIGEPRQAESSPVR